MIALLMFKLEPSREIAYEWRQTLVTASHGQSWTVLSSHTMQPPDPPFDRVFLIWMGVFGKIVFWPWDRRGQAGAGPWFCARILIVSVYLCKPSTLPRSHTVRGGRGKQSHAKNPFKKRKSFIQFHKQNYSKKFVSVICMWFDYGRVRDHLWLDLRI